ncbi:MAG: hypothetical protein ABI843_09725 [Dokdonella sp.]
MNPRITAFDQLAFLLKLQPTEGVDALPTPVLNAFQILEGTAKINATGVDRKITKPYWNTARKKFGKYYVEINGTIELVTPANPGVDKSPHGVALQICGMAETLRAAAVGPPAVDAATVYNMISRNIPAGTGYFYHADEYYKGLDMRGDLSSLTQQIGVVPTAKLKLWGNCQNTIEADLPTGLDYSKFLEPTIGSTESMELTIDDFAVQGISHVFEFGNTLGIREHTLARTSRISGRQSTFKAQFYRTAKADFDPYAKWKKGDIVEVVSTTFEDGGDGRYWNLRTLGQVIDVDKVDADNENTFQVSFQAVASDAGNDECALEFAQS